MKHLRSLLPLLLALLFVSVSCLDDRDARLWRSGNEDFMEALKDSSNVYPVEIRDSLISAERGAEYQPSAPSGIYFKEIQKGSGVVPLLGQTVTVKYSGWLYDDTAFDDGLITFELGTTTIDGFTVTVQRMHVGDIWEVYIPYYLGYGQNTYYYSTPNIPGYSTLIFRMELKSVS